MSDGKWETDISRLRSQALSICPEQHAARVSILAFRSAWHSEVMRDLASAQALRAYQNLLPDAHDAADKVVGALVDALRHRPHWVEAEG